MPDTEDFCHLIQEPAFAGSLRLCARYRKSKADGPLHVHQHDDALEIIYLAQGHLYFEVEGQGHSMMGGSVMLIPPQTQHGSTHTSQGKGHYYCLHLHLEKPWFEDASRGMESLRKQCLQRMNEPIQVRWLGHQAQQHLDHFIDCHESREQGHDMAELQMKMAILSFLMLLINPNSSPSASPEIIKSLDFIKDHLCEPLPVEQLAQIAQLSRNAFSTRFRQELGCTPADYVAHAKITHAQQLLSHSPLSITEIAHQLSFSSSQHFATQFKRYTHDTPKAYRQKTAKAPRVP